MAFASHAHNYFVSTANMEYDDSTKQIEVSVKMTAHDFEHVLEMKYQQRLHIENIADTSEIGKYIQEYLKENFVVSCGEKPVILTITVRKLRCVMSCFSISLSVT